MDQEPIIVTCELRKVYGEISVIDGLNLEVPRGSICGLLGRNRAAKTTLLKMFVGLTRPTSVEGRIFGLRIDRSAESIEIRQSAAFVSKDKMFPGATTVAEIIRFTRAFYPRWRSDLEQQYTFQTARPRHGWKPNSAATWIRLSGDYRFRSSLFSISLPQLLVRARLSCSPTRNSASSRLSAS